MESKVINEALGGDFNLGEFQNCKTFAARLKYCKEHLGPSFGKGSSRIIFELTDELVLKLAINEKGKAQNRVEAQMSRENDGIVVNVESVSDDYEWIIEENVLPAKKSDFKKVLNLSWDDFQSFVVATFNAYAPNGRKSFYYAMDDEMYEYCMEEHPDNWFFRGIWDYMTNYNIPLGDMLRLSTYGLTERDGDAQIIILDAGLTYEVYNQFYARRMNESETIEEEVSLKPFEPKEQLHPKFWVNNKLNSKVRMRLLDIADDFVKTLDIRWVKPEDIVLTGSIANYNWTKYSDVDIHIIMDFKKVYKKTDFVKNFFDAKKTEWNSTHEKLKIYGFNVELSVEDLDAPAEASGVYSLEKNDWVKEPKDLSDAKLNKEYVKQTAEKYLDKIDKLEKQISKENDAKKVETLSNKMLSIFNTLKGMRREGLKTKAKEMSSGNIIWKILRAEGYIKKIWDIINYNYDKQMSLNEGSWGVLPLQSDDGLDFKAQLTRKVLEVNKKELDSAKSTREAYSALGNVLLLLKKIKGWYMKDDLVKSGLEKSIKDKIGYLNKNIEDFLYPWNNDVKDDAKTIVENLPKVYDKILDQYALDGDNYECPEKDDDLEGDGLLATCYKSMTKNKKEKLNEGYIDDLIADVYENVDVYTVLMDFKNAPKGSKQYWNLINPSQYNRALQDYMQNGEAMRFPERIVDEWVELIMRNSLQLQANTEISGHSSYFPEDDFREVFEDEYEQWCTNKGIEPDYSFESCYDFLYERGWDDYAVAPDGRDAISDYGLKPLGNILNEYNPSMSVGEKLILVNRCLDVWHHRGDLASMFIKGGSKVLTQISAGNYVNENKSKTVIVYETQLKEMNPGYGNVYLNSWLGRFRKALNNDSVTTSALHDAMKRFGFKQVIPGVYRKTDLEWALGNIDRVKRSLGLLPKEMPREYTVTRDSVENNKPAVDDTDDNTPPLSKMDVASDELLRQDDVYENKKKSKK